jgi:hypothetical protein
LETINNQHKSRTMKKKELTFEEALDLVNPITPVEQEPEVVGNIYQKLWRAKQEIGKVVKGNDNPFFKSRYADLNTILEAVEPSLFKHGLIVLQPCLDNIVETRIVDCESGDMVQSSLVLPEITDPQKRIAAVTYFRRATLQSLLSLQAVDDDGNTATEAIKTQKPQISARRLNDAIQSILKGDYTVEKLKANFDLTQDQLNYLNSEL